MATGRRPPTSEWNGLSRKLSRSSIITITAVTDPMRTACVTARSPLSAKKSMYTKMTTEMKKRTIQSGDRDHADRPVDPVLPGLLAGRCLLEPLVVGGLLARAGRLDALQRAEHRHSPGIEGIAQSAGLHPLPLAVHDVPAVADELARQLAAGGAGEELGGLDLLRHHERLGLGAGARLVVAREGEEDDEAEQNREAGRQHAEHAGGAVSVGEIAPLGRPPADEQHRRDGDRGYRGGDRGIPKRTTRTTANPKPNPRRRRMGTKRFILRTMSVETEPAPFLRPDGKEKVTGSGRYTADLSLTGQLHAQVPLRRPHARAHRLHRREPRPGAAGRARRRHARGRAGRALRRPRAGSAAVREGRVRFEGDVVAAVAALTPRSPPRPLPLIEVEYEPLQPSATSRPPWTTTRRSIHEGWESYEARRGPRPRRQRPRLLDRS